MTKNSSMVSASNNAILDAVCAANPVTHQACAASVWPLYKLFTSDSFYDTCGSAIDDENGQCSPACHQMLRQAILQDGCCVSTFLNAFQSSLPGWLGLTGGWGGDAASSTASSWSRILSLCNQTIAPCPSSSTNSSSSSSSTSYSSPSFLISFIIENLNFQYYDANSESVKQSLREDVASGVGLSANSIFISDVQAYSSTTNGETMQFVKVWATVSVPTAMNLQMIMMMLEQLTSGGRSASLALSETIALTASQPTAALIRPSQSLVATSVEATSPSPAPSSSPSSPSDASPSVSPSSTPAPSTGAASISAPPLSLLTVAFTALLFVGLSFSAI